MSNQERSLGLTNSIETVMPSYLGEITSFLTPDLIPAITQAANGLIAASSEERIAQLQAGGNVLFSNELGTRLLVSEDEVRPDLAVQCFEYAFEQTLLRDPYNPVITTYAGNFIEALMRWMNLRLSTDAKPEALTPNQEFLLKDDLKTLPDVVKCLVHYKNLACYQEGYENHVYDQGKLEWRNQNRQSTAQNMDTGLGNANWIIEQGKTLFKD